MSEVTYEQDEENWRLYRSLWYHLQDRGVRVMYTDKRLPDSVLNSVGWFEGGHILFSDSPTVCISRVGKHMPETAFLPDKLPDAGEHEQELHTLAHEYGHFMSNRSGFWSPTLEESYRRVHKRHGMTSAQIDAVLDEEHRAWWYGAKWLTRNGTISRDSMSDHRKRALSAYRSLMVKRWSLVWIDAVLDRFANWLARKVKKS